MSSSAELATFTGWAATAPKAPLERLSYDPGPLGAEEVEGWGGCVHLADLEPGHSTTATIQYLSEGGSDSS